MNVQPLVSIVVCTYNGAPFLEKQIASLQFQTWKNIEIIICDDRSSDDTEQIITRLIKNDNRISFHKNPVTLGVNKNFEHGCLMAAGDLVAICDQDDIWREDKIEKLVALFDNDDVLLAHCQSVRFTDEPPYHITHYTKRNMFSGSDERKLLLFNTIAGHNIMFRKQLLQFAVPFPQAVFYDWWLCVVAACYGRVNATEEVLTFHRHHENNLTLGKGDEKKQTRAKALERTESLRLFLTIPGMDAEAKQFGSGLLMKLQLLDGNSFSPGLMSFLLRHAAILFFFKRKPFPLITYLKISYRLSWAI